MNKVDNVIDFRSCKKGNEKLGKTEPSYKSVKISNNYYFIKRAKGRLDTGLSHENMQMIANVIFESEVV